MVYELEERIGNRSDKTSSSALDIAFEEIKNGTYSLIRSESKYYLAAQFPKYASQMYHFPKEIFDGGSSNVRVLSFTGCQHSNGLPLMLMDFFYTPLLPHCTNLSGADVCHWLWLLYSAHVLMADPTNKSQFQYVSMPNLSAPYKSCDVKGATLTAMVSADFKNYQRTLYHISLAKKDADPAEKRSTAFKNLAIFCDKKQMEKTEDALKNHWDQASSHPDCIDSHVFCLLVNRQDGLLIQSYYGLYTMHDWLRFDQVLQRNTLLPPPKSASYITWRQVRQAPKYRKVLSATDVLALAADLDQLTTNQPDHGKRLADITGVEYDPKIIDTSYMLKVVRIVF